MLLGRVFMGIEKGNKVKVEYVGKLDSGDIFDSSEKHGQPLEFEAGAGNVIKGFDEAIIGMEKGDTKDIVIKPEEAYGNENPQLIQKIPREQIPIEQELKAGMVLGMQMPNGQQVPARITEANDKEVTIDLNHPLAGKTLNFNIKVVDFS